MAPNLISPKKLGLLLLFSLSLLSLISSTPTYLANYCSNDTLFTPNSQYQSNLNTLIHSLSSNATSTTAGFSASSAGATTSTTVYGLFLCRGDQNTTSCSNCVTTATTTGLKKNCSLGKSAIIWYEKCMVRYSDKPLLGKMSTSQGENIRSSVNVPGNQTQFVEILEELMQRVRSEAIGDAKRFGAGEEKWLGSEKVYGLGQCTPDLDPDDCDLCLQAAIGSFPLGFDETASGGTALMPSCFAQYDTHPFFNSLKPSSSSNTGKKRSRSVIIAIVVPVIVALVVLLPLCICLIKRKNVKKFDAFAIEIGEGLERENFLQYNLDTLKYATNNFSEENKLGEGGFGGVYKGVLRNGQEIAVKRLSKSSTQGVQEFKNEVLLVAKLQHRNLVQVFGFCLAKKEKLLIYEFVPNKSLNYFLFDAEKRGELNWEVRFKIIQGIAQGMLYLHQDSRPGIIHRDLKASNVLLDADMTPKISDFGMSRIFGMDEQQRNTTRIVGTYGYMAPEYALRGQFSVKTDVYSFGVLILEIISGKRNNNFYFSDLDDDLLGYAWKQWKEGTPLNFVDSTIRHSCSTDEVMRCIQLGLVCVQNSVEKRPTMAMVVRKLSSSSDKLPVPEKPAFYIKNKAERNSPRETGFDRSIDKFTSQPSMNGISISQAEPR